jgi:hypothetical protein
MPALAPDLEAMQPDAVVPDSVVDAPIKRLEPKTLIQMGQHLDSLFNQFKSDRQLAELRWLRNQRQYLGVYDQDVEKELLPGRSRAYPKLTRIKCISVLAKIMNLMFQGNDRNWTLKAKPWPSMEMEDVMEAVKAAQEADQSSGGQPSKPTRAYVMAAVKKAAAIKAKTIMDLIDDQFQELGGDQSSDYVTLNRKVLASGIVYGLGVLRGPFAKPCEMLSWDDDGDIPMPKSIKAMKPEFEFLPVWDFYPDMAAKNFASMDGYFVRKVMSRSQLRALANREDFMRDQIIDYLKTHEVGNYRPQPYETELRAMGVKANVNEMKTESMKYEVLFYHGPITGQFLQLCGEEIAEESLADDMDAEIAMIDGIVIKGVVNPWKDLGVENMKMIHTFCFDEDDTSPIGFGLPTALRDTQMAICASTRMLLDNASVVCGPNIEVNTDLMRPDQDVTSITAYKVWYREGTDQSAQWPAVRNVQIDAHIDGLLKMIDLFMKIADMETFVGPATGGDMQKGPSEPFRTAAGASMLRGEAALPFKDIIRAFDSLTTSVVQAVLVFNQKFNKKMIPAGDYNVIARGATSLMAKEARGAAADNFAATMTPDEKMYIDARKLAEVRACARDLDDVMVDDDEALRRENQQAASAKAEQDQKNEIFQATLREQLAAAFKNITQGQKNTAAADAASVNAALDLLERGITNGVIEGGGMGTDPNAPAGAQAPGPGGPNGGPAPGGPAGNPQGPVGPGAPGGLPALAG